MRRPRPLLPLLLALALLASLASSATAGGWAVVRLDEEPGEIVAGEPWRLGFTVLQHDIHPVNVEGVYLSAHHRESGDEVRADARQEGAEGHYVVEVTFPTAGSWKWSITPGWFAPTSFESLEVLASPSVAGSELKPGVVPRHPAAIHAGSCAQFGAVAHRLSETLDAGALKGSQPLAATSPLPGGANAPVAISLTTIESTLTQLTAAPHAIVVGESAQAAIACGEIGGYLWNGELVVGLRSLNGSGATGIALLREESGRTTIALYLMNLGGTEAAPPTVEGKAVAIEISGATFSPGRIEIAAGTTVVWTNRDGIAHTVQSDNLAFEDSGPLAAGDTFQQTFTTPGTYAYYCGPHPSMTGTIVVT